MGNSSRASSPLDTARRRGRKKKKGRPSLLDLQKRSLRLQKQQQESLKRKRRNPNNSNPYLRFPNSASARRSTRHNPNPSTSDRDEDDEVEEEEEEDDENVSRKEKKLRHVLDAAASNSPDRTGRAAAAAAATNCGAKATDEEDAEPSEPGPTTPLPDKKLLVFVLDRLQKKDSYGVFSEPVDPEELPDYHDIIDHPMDFGTVRKKLDQGEYASLEQFESDIFLICSNAMVYNASDTIYYRQARTIQELAKKDFANLRAESENSSEHEPKPAPRRGRPPMKKPGRPPAAERVTPDPSTDAGPTNVGTSGRAPTFLEQDLSHKQRNKAAVVDPTKSLLGLRILENNLSNDHRSERTDDFLGFGIKGGWSKWGPKLSEIDDSKRSTYDHPKPSDSVQESPIFATFDGGRKVLIPVGIHQQHAYSRSLARFAAKLSPTAWKIAAKRIEQVLPPGTKFGRGWVGEPEGPQELHPSQKTASPATSSQEPNTAPTSSRAPPPQVPSDSQHTDIRPKPSSPAASVSGSVTPATTVGGLQKAQSNPQYPLNGFHASLLGNMSSQVKNGVGNMTTVLGGISQGRGGISGRGQVESEGLKFGGGNGTLPVGSSGVGANRSVAPPDLNVGFQSPGPGSPRSAGVGMDKQQQQPDLALQL